jgi:diguanylate cyclase (GGDEF)-like protein
MDDEKPKEATGDPISGGPQPQVEGTPSNFERVSSKPSRRDVAGLLEAGKLLASSTQHEQLNLNILKAVEENLQPTSWFLFLWDEEKQELYCELAVGERALEFKDHRVKAGQGIAGWVVEHCEPLVLPSVSQDAQLFSEVGEMRRLKGHSAMALPLLVHGKCLGVIQLIDCVGFEAPLQSDLSPLQAFADCVAAAIETAEYQHMIQEFEIVDDRTGVYQARHIDYVLDVELRRSERYSYDFSLVVLEIDQFEKLASFLAAPALNQLLDEMGHHIKAGLRQIDFAFYRDEGNFVLILPQAPRDVASTLVGNLQNLIETTSWLAQEGLNMHLTVSVGVATFPGDAQTKSDLIRLAEENLQA